LEDQALEFGPAVVLAEVAGWDGTLVFMSWT